jgi:hypothetical protein
MHVYVCLRLYVCMCVCMCTMYICMYVRMYVLCVCACAYLCMYVCMCTMYFFNYYYIQHAPVHRVILYAWKDQHVHVHSIYILTLQYTLMPWLFVSYFVCFDLICRCSWYCLKRVT